jgi:hypothetical protein
VIYPYYESYIKKNEEYMEKWYFYFNLILFKSNPSNLLILNNSILEKYMNKVNTLQSYTNYFLNYQYEASQSANYSSD